jgi:predicted flap endonuclease-1-like 5' DNA nuclease
MYSINLAKFTLDEFQEVLTSIDLLPSRRVLLENLPEVIDALKGKEIFHLEALRKWLANKKQYPELAASLAVNAEYLTILNREVNSYLSKPIPLADLNVFTEAELENLASAALKNTRDLYEQAATPASRHRIAAQVSLAPEKILHALQLSDLLRINGVGPAYAALLWQVGIQNAASYLHLPSAEILVRCQQAGAKLGLKDVEYCKRFCRKLDSDIEW